MRHFKVRCKILKITGYASVPWNSKVPKVKRLIDVRGRCRIDNISEQSRQLWVRLKILVSQVSKENIAKWNSSECIKVLKREIDERTICRGFLKKQNFTTRIWCWEWLDEIAHKHTEVSPTLPAVDEQECDLSKLFRNFSERPFPRLITSATLPYWL